jgi:hypothetical protein
MTVCLAEAAHTAARRGILPERLENLHQFGVDEFVAADQVAGFQRVVVAFDALRRCRRLRVR